MKAVLLALVLASAGCAALDHDTSALVERLRGASDVGAPEGAFESGFSIHSAETLWRAELSVETWHEYEKTRNATALAREMERLHAVAGWRIAAPVAGGTGFQGERDGIAVACSAGPDRDAQRLACVYQLA